LKDRGKNKKDHSLYPKLRRKIMSLLKITDLSEGLVDLSDDQIERINGGRTVTSSSSTTAFGNGDGTIITAQSGSQQVFAGTSFDLSKFSSFFD
jgi:hypothetical protein